MSSSAGPSLRRACRAPGSQRNATSAGRLLESKDEEGPGEGGTGGPWSKAITELSVGGREEEEEETHKPDEGQSGLYDASDERVC